MDKLVQSQTLRDCYYVFMFDFEQVFANRKGFSQEYELSGRHFLIISLHLNMHLADTRIFRYISF